MYFCTLLTNEYHVYKLRQTTTTTISQPPSSFILSHESTYVTLPYLSLLKEWMNDVMTKVEWIMKVHRSIVCMYLFFMGLQLKISFPALYSPFYVLALECSQISFVNKLLWDISLSCKSIGRLFLAAGGGKQQMYSFGRIFVQRQTLFCWCWIEWICFKVLLSLQHT